MLSLEAQLQRLGTRTMCSHDQLASVLLPSCTTSSFAPTGQTCLVFLQGCMVLFQLLGKYSSPAFPGQKKPALPTRKSRAKETHTGALELWSERICTPALSAIRSALTRAVEVALP